MQRGSRSAAGRHQKYQPAPWFTRVRALLAGALVLGVGATLTLASWTDQEYAQGSFATSTFAIEGAADGTFGDHSATPAPLLFTATAAAMSPGSITYSRFVVRTTAATTVAGTVQMSGATVGGNGLGDYLTYGVRTIAAGGACESTTYASGVLVIADGSVLTGGSSTVQALPAAGSASVTYCFAIKLPVDTPNSMQGKNATATWTFTGTSNS